MASKINMDPEELEYIKRTYKDWDFTIGHWLNNLPYLWRNDSDDWRLCSRLYLFDFDDISYNGIRYLLTFDDENPEIHKKCEYLKNFFGVCPYENLWASDWYLNDVRVNGVPYHKKENLPSLKKLEDILPITSGSIYSYPKNIIIPDIPEEHTTPGKGQRTELSDVDERRFSTYIIYRDYLSKKHKNTCFPLYKYKFEEHSSTQGIHTINYLYSTYIRMYASIEDDEEHVIDNVEIMNSATIKRTLRKCFANPDIKFVCLNIGILVSSETHFMAHANVALIDIHTGNIYVIEPHGETLFIKWDVGMSKFYDTLVKDILNPINKREWKINHPTSFCPKTSFQSLEVAIDEREGDPGGFCYIWGPYIADLILSNPGQDPATIINMGIAYIKSQHPNFTSFIRNLQEYILDRLGNDNLAVAKSEKEFIKIVDKMIKEYNKQK